MSADTKTHVPEKPAHMYEIDLIRAITVFSVVALHSLSYTKIFVSGDVSILWLNLIGHFLHYTREMFMFVTGLVLTYVYFYRPFSARTFWLKRFLLVFVPYVLWTAIYVLLNNHGLSIGDYLNRFFWDVITGEASFQLYYILLSLQFYAIFPIFLLLLKKVVTHPWLVLGVSLIIQLVFVFLDYKYIQTGIVHPSGLYKTLVKYQDRILITYQFFFILGAFVAVYLNQVNAALKKFGRLLPGLFIITIISYLAYFFWHVSISRHSLYYITSVLQPSVVVYSTTVIAVMMWLALLWAKNKKAFPIIKTISDTSFGIYFVHVLLLSYTMDYLVPMLPSSLPAIVKILLVLGVAFTTSVLFCVMLLKVPFLSWTIGRVQKKK